jgi:hypothetical protein
MTRDELKRHFPEAIVPKDRAESIPSEITASPLYKQAGSESKAVDAFASKLVEFAKENQDTPEFKAGRKWYSEFVPRLKKEFGKDAQTMAELLAATSPQTNVETNFAYALDALESLKAGRFDKIISKFEQGLEMIEDNTWLAWYNRHAKDVPNAPAEPTPAAFLAHWIETHNLKPRQSNGKLYGQHSLPVLQVRRPSTSCRTFWALATKPRLTCGLTGRCGDLATRIRSNAGAFSRRTLRVSARQILRSPKRRFAVPPSR